MAPTGLSCCWWCFPVWISWTSKKCKPDNLKKRLKWPVLALMVMGCCSPRQCSLLWESPFCLLLSFTSHLRMLCQMSSPFSAQRSTPSLPLPAFPINRGFPSRSYISQSPCVFTKSPPGSGSCHPEPCAFLPGGRAPTLQQRSWTGTRPGGAGQWQERAMSLTVELFMSLAASKGGWPAGRGRRSSTSTLLCWGPIWSAASSSEAPT